jgi:hypothetical protein
MTGLGKRTLEVPTVSPDHERLGRPRGHGGQNLELRGVLADAHREAQHSSSVDKRGRMLRA